VPKDTKQAPGPIKPMQHYLQRHNIEYIDIVFVMHEFRTQKLLSTTPTMHTRKIGYQPPTYASREGNILITLKPREGLLKYRIHPFHVFYRASI
jgi:predicted protein tyrosine phosphatase